ncbi:hypothetical protein EFN80_01050 [Lactococcus lactis]|uniref:Structural protein 5 n=1 Tax=Lactococcus lactis TaxID=1358 RepID=A0A9X4S550_9LACT|nr:hypothetical protein [Lactococcus lactis]KSU03519.1 Phage protein [Lactococcus lactis subsp. lactis]MCT1192792.1 hypothetical protein [Lactococcus lactis]MCT3086414.1 hypothetical protein [Lactococcus lactis]MDG4958479.1 hypothetical protein [Lactococcus lactis]MDG4983091.1 hypothetical protein [Lactococcus lactis]
MKQLSTARKFKMITGKDLFQQQKEMEKVSKTEDGDVTDVMEFVQFGLYLALFQDNISLAKQEFAEFRETYKFDTNGKGLKELVDIWKKEI